MTRSMTHARSDCGTIHERVQEWEKPEVDPKMVSSELEAIMAERFPELSPLLLETSFSNKQAPWRQQGKGTGSNSPSRAASLSVSRAGSITQPRYTTCTMCTCMNHVSDRPAFNVTADCAHQVSRAIRVTDVYDLSCQAFDFKLKVLTQITLGLLPTHVGLLLPPGVAHTHLGCNGHRRASLWCLHIPHSPCSSPKVALHNPLGPDINQ